MFYTPEDADYFLELLEEGVERYGHRIHAYCLMTNHIHLVIQTGEISLSKIIQNVSFRYTRRINRRMDRVGHLFQGRFRAILVDENRYLKGLIRYVHKNPAQAGMAGKTEDYRWSSHSVYLGKTVVPWLTTDFVLSFFGKSQKTARRKYRLFMDGKKDDYGEIIQEGPQVLGDDRFLRSILKRSAGKSGREKTMDEIVDVVCREYRIDRRDLIHGGKQRKYSEARALTALIVRSRTGLRLTELGKMLGKDNSTLSQGAGRVMKRMKGDPEFSRRFDRVIQELF